MPLPSISLMCRHFYLVICFYFQFFFSVNISLCFFTWPAEIVYFISNLQSEMNEMKLINQAFRQNVTTCVQVESLKKLVWLMFFTNLYILEILVSKQRKKTIGQSSVFLSTSIHHPSVSLFFHYFGFHVLRTTSKD